jgi:hypothetical protein
MRNMSRGQSFSAEEIAAVKEVSQDYLLTEVEDRAKDAARMWNERCDLLKSSLPTI